MSEPNTTTVLVHGWCCDHTFLEPQAAWAAARGPVLAPDLRGHGAAPDRPGHTIADFADDVAEAISAGPGGPALIVGHSMGGLIALELAARGVAAAAVLLDCAPILDEPGKAYFAASAPKVAVDDDGAWRTRFFTRLRAPRPETFLPLVTATSTQVASEAMAGMARFDAAAALRRVSVPVLAITAAPGEDMGAVTALAPTVEPVALEGVGHFLHLERPDLVADLMGDFLTRHRLA